MSSSRQGGIGSGFSLGIGVQIIVALAVALAIWSAVPVHAEGQPPEQPLTEVCAGLTPPGEGHPACGTVNPTTSARVRYFFAYNAGDVCTGGAQSAGGEVEGHDIAVSASLSGLAPDTRYAYCLVAANAYGESYGETLVFRTAPTSPPKEEEPLEEGEEESLPEQEEASPAPEGISAGASGEQVISPASTGPGKGEAQAIDRSVWVHRARRLRLRLMRQLKACRRISQTLRRKRCRRRAHRRYAHARRRLERARRQAAPFAKRGATDGE